MPTYRNNGVTAKSVLGTEVAAGDYICTRKYLDPIPTNFTLTNNEPLSNIPTLLFGAAPDGSTISGLTVYDALMVENLSGATLVLTFNGQTDDAIRIPSGVVVTIADLKNDYNSITVSGAGTDPAYVHGLVGDSTVA